MARRGTEGPREPVVRFDGETMPSAKPATPEARMAQPGDVIDGRYRLMLELGRGGMGVVLLAEDARLKRNVALKFLRPNSTETDVARFRREAQLLAQLSHPNVVRVFDLGERANLPYFVMEYLDGRTLADVLHDTHGDGLPVDVALGFGRQLCEALDVVHRQGIIHRDIKPGNVIITAGMKAVLMDFGLARKELSARDRSVVSGTPQYLPPEDIRGAPLEGDDARRSDIYALGITLYELIASRPPFSDEDTSLVLHRQLLDPPPRLCDLRPDVPPAFEAVIMRALEKDPMARQASCGELLVELARARAQTVARTSQQMSRVTMDVARVRETLAPTGNFETTKAAAAGKPVPAPSAQPAQAPQPAPAVQPAPARLFQAKPGSQTVIGQPFTRDPSSLGDADAFGSATVVTPPGMLPAGMLDGQAGGDLAAPQASTDPLRVAVVLHPGSSREQLIGAMRDLMPFTDIEVWPSGPGGTTILPAVVAFSPECVIVDNELLEESPYELCAQLRSDPATANVPLLVASEDVGPEQQRLFLRLGIDSILPKPLYADRLVARIRRAVDALSPVG